MSNFTNAAQSDVEHIDWLPVSDMMSGLMMIFLFIAVVVIKTSHVEPSDSIDSIVKPTIEPITEPAIEHIVAPEITLQEKIYTQLNREFAQDLHHWRASINKHDLTLSFHKSNGMFASGLADLNPQYNAVFSEFYPRYIRIIEPFVHHIHEIRVEGHTSSGWKDAKTDFEAYINNLSLSQRRAFSVLAQLAQLDSHSTSKAILFSKFTSIGYASSHPVFNQQGEEDPQASRRVAFRIVLPTQDLN